MSLNTRLLVAALANSIPAGESGRWMVTKFALNKPIKVPRENGRVVTLPPRTYTQLWCATEAKMHLRGELVMDDTEYEVRKHLEFMRRARGRVLITGLGLGCVVRGCLANPAVREVVCIERSPDVLKLVGPSMPKDRLTIIEADALEWVPKNAEASGFDCAWHDIWSDPDKGEPALALSHSQLLRDSVVAGIYSTGAWAFPHDIKKAWNRLHTLRLV